MVPVGKSPLSRNKRSEPGDALAHADVHSVPSKLLNGFIKQARLKECRAKLEERYVEPRFASGSELKRSSRIPSDPTISYSAWLLCDCIWPVARGAILQKIF